MEAIVQITNDLERRIYEAFGIFDHHGDKHVDTCEIGTILRFLGCAPTEQEVNDVIAATQVDEECEEVHLSKFLPHVCQLLFEKKMQPASAEKLMEAFQVLDPEARSFLTQEEMTRFMLEEGEPLSEKELREMMAIAVDPVTGNIPYEFYLNHLTHVPKVSIYETAERVHGEKSKSKNTRASKYD